ncbi:hypothetical protein I4U23_015826 [Adineta vaga]|nr:hypothetical protein I4U23_015826 [Adineta vaga]
MTFSERRMKHVHNPVRCEISSTDNICRLIRTSSDETNEETDKEALTILDLSKCNIDDNTVQNLTDALEQDNTVLTLNLAKNKIQDIGAQYLANMLKHNTTLLTLKLGENETPYCMIVEKIVTIRGGRTLTTTLTFLSLQMNEIGDDGALHLAGALKDSKVLKTICLGRNGISTKVWDELTSIDGKEILN